MKNEMEKITKEKIESIIKELKNGFDGDTSYHSGVNDGMYALFHKLNELRLIANKTLIPEQAEFFNDAELFLMDKLKVEVLPKNRVILGAYEIAKWMSEYAYRSDLFIEWCLRNVHKTSSKKYYIVPADFSRETLNDVYKYYLTTKQK